MRQHKSQSRSGVAVGARRAHLDDSGILRRAHVQQAYKSHSCHTGLQLAGKAAVTPSCAHTCPGW